MMLKENNIHDPNAKESINFTIRLNEYELQLLNDAYHKSTAKSKNKLIKEILMPKLRELGDY